MRALNKNDTSVYRPLVFIISPLFGEDHKSVIRTNRLFRYAAVMGFLPVATVPVYAEIMIDTDPDDRELMFWTDNVLMGKCDEVWILSDLITERMQVLIDIAEHRRKKIRFFTDDLDEVDDPRGGERR